MANRGVTRSLAPPGCHILVYDADCRFCSAAARLVQFHATSPLELVPLSAAQDAGLLTALTAEEVPRAAHYVSPSGEELHGGASVTGALRLGPLGFLFAVLDFPGVAMVRDAVYQLVARHRRRGG